MLWRGQRESDNVEDRRGFGAGKMGGGALILGAIVYYFMGGNPLTYVAQNIGATQGQTQSPADQAQDSDRKSFASVVLADTEDVWTALFQNLSRGYTPPKLVLFRNRVQSGCGSATEASGPFYCPSDQKVYLDLSFFDELSKKLGAGGDFAAAYVIAHEVGHHVQHLLGIDREAGSTNQASVQIELQADCFAGVWAKQTQNTKHVIEDGDIDEALNAAAAVGDDRLQKMSRGYVVPDSFTHGSSQQRQSAFRQGFSGGEIESCLKR